MKEIKDDINKYSIFLSRKINIVKITILPKATNRFSVIPNKLPMVFYIELELNI